MLGGGLQSLIPDRGGHEPTNNQNPPTDGQSAVHPTPSIPNVFTPSPESKPEPAPPVIFSPAPQTPAGTPTPPSDGHVGEIPIPNVGAAPFSSPTPISPLNIYTEPTHPATPTPPDADREVGSSIPSPTPANPTPIAPAPATSTSLETISDREPHDYIFQLEVDKIKPNPHQPRREFDESSLREMASSIAEFGIIQPLVVTKRVFETPTGTGVEYELIAGERRLRAARLAGLERVPAIIRNTPPKKEKLEMAIIENIQRENLNPIESARAFSQLQDEFNMTQREIAARVGKSRESIANTMRLLSLPTYVQEAVAVGRVSESQARLLLTIADFSAQQNLFEELIKNNLSVRELRSRIVSASARANAVRRFNETDPEIRHLEERLSELLGTKVKVEKSGDTGRITISFASPEELKGIIDRVLPPGEEI